MHSQCVVGLFYYGGACIYKCAPVVIIIKHRPTGRNNLFAGLEFDTYDLMWQWNIIKLLLNFLTFLQDDYRDLWYC